MRNIFFLFVALVVFLIVAPQVFAINFSKSVNYLKVELTQDGKIATIRKTGSRLDKVELLLYLPQKDSRQKVEILEVFPATYEILNDEFGNDQIKLVWTNPAGDMEYRIRTRVEISSVPVLGEDNPLFVKETKLTKSNREMVEKSLEFKGGYFKRLAEMAAWVNENVLYDKNFENVTNSAEWVFENRKGVCDEFAGLFISLARAQSFSARYIVGLAYSEEFVPHGWAEVFIDGEWMPFDPTWNEANYLDATHLKLANLPDGNFSEYIYVEGYNTDVNWETTEYDVKILEEREEYPIEIKAQLLSREIGLGYAIFKATVTPNECLMSTLTLKSCLQDTSEVFEVFDEEKNLIACNPSDVYWIAGYKGVNLRKDTIYICPLTIDSDFGNTEKEDVTLDPSKQLTEFEIFQEKILVSSKQKFTISINSEDPVSLYFLYLDNLNNSVFAGRRDFEFSAPEKAGRYKVWFVSSDGFGKSIDVEVVKEKLIEVLSVEAPRNVTKGEWFLINASFKSLTDRSLEGKLVLISEERVSRSITLIPYSDMMESFNITLEKLGENQIKIIFDFKDDHEVFVVDVDVLKREEPSFFENIWDFITKIINSILSIFRL